MLDEFVLLCQSIWSHKMFSDCVCVCDILFGLFVACIVLFSANGSIQVQANVLESAAMQAVLRICDASIFVHQKPPAFLCNKTHNSKNKIDYSSAHSLLMRDWFSLLKLFVHFISVLFVANFAHK